jgi:hypothetical protein
MIRRRSLIVTTGLGVAGALAGPALAADLVAAAATPQEDQRLSGRAIGQPDAPVTVQNEPFVMALLQSQDRWAFAHGVNSTEELAKLAASE